MLTGRGAGLPSQLPLCLRLRLRVPAFLNSLRGNTIEVAGAKALASALKVNSSLQRLNLQENSLGMEGAICVATALSGNHGLRHINLQGNHIGESGARMISEAIKTNAPSCTVEM